MRELKNSINKVSAGFPELEYPLLSTVEVDENNMPKEYGAVNGGMMQRSEEIKCPVLTIGVENIDEAIKKLEGLCGKIVQGKNGSPKHGSNRLLQRHRGQCFGAMASNKTAIASA